METDGILRWEYLIKIGRQSRLQYRLKTRWSEVETRWRRDEISTDKMESEMESKMDSEVESEVEDDRDYNRD